MNTRCALILGLCLIACCLILGKSFGEAPAQRQIDQAVPGRYQMMRDSGSQLRVIVLDTATGHCWLKNFDATGPTPGWQNYGSPTESRGKK
jgi:hypothetical protein